MEKRVRPAWKYASLLLGMVILILLILSVTHPAPNPVGTFCTGDGISPDDRYLVLHSDQTYTLYRQFALLESGSFSAESSEADFLCLTLRAEDGLTVHQAILSRDGTLYLLEQDEFLPLKKISDTPTYINISSP